MTEAHTPPAPPVIVGVDGSRHALRAALWAADEAIDRGTCLRLVYIIAPDTDGIAADTEQARLILQNVRGVVESTTRPVRTECQILHGDPAAGLREASRAGQLMCLGAKGMHDSATRRGATAAAIAESAFCPVAIVRRRGRRRLSEVRWVVAVLDDSPVASEVWRVALDEAERRDAPLLALTSWPSRLYGYHLTGDDLRAELDRRLASDRDEAGVRVHAASIPEHLAALLARTPDLDQLVVIGKSNPDLIAELVGPEGRSLLRKTNCSVMIIRGDQCEALAAS